MERHQGLRRREAPVWELPPTGAMRVPCLVFGTPSLIAALEAGVLTQLRNVAGLPGVIGPVVAMPDTPPGYGQNACRRGGLGEEAPQAYKDIEDVVQTAHALGLASKTARLLPLACIKG